MSVLGISGKMWLYFPYSCSNMQILKHFCVSPALLWKLSWQFNEVVCIVSNSLVLIVHLSSFDKVQGWIPAFQFQILIFISILALYQLNLGLPKNYQACAKRGRRQGEIIIIISIYISKLYYFIYILFCIMYRLYNL